MTTYRVEVKPPLPPEPPNDGAFWFDPKEDLGEVWYRAGDGWFRMGGKYRFGWSEVCEHTDPAKWVRLVKDPADEARELPAIRERVAAGEEMWLGLSRDEAELLLAEIDRTAAALAAAYRDYQVVEEDRDSMMPVVEAVKAFLLVPGADDDADALVAAVERVAAAEQDRDEAHAAGFAEAVAMLRDDARYSNWWSAVPPKPGKPTGRYWDATARGHLADYLETVVLPLPGAESGQRSGKLPVCADCGHRHRWGGACADHSWTDSCPYDAGADCEAKPSGTEPAPLTDLIGIAPDRDGMEAG